MGCVNALDYAARLSPAYLLPIASALGNCNTFTCLFLLFSAVYIFLVIVLPIAGGIGLIGGIVCLIIGIIICIQRSNRREANAQRAVVVQPQTVALYPVYAGSVPGAPPGGMVPGQPVFMTAAPPGGMVPGQPVFMPAAPPGGIVPGQPVFLPGNPFMQTAFTAPPVDVDKASSPSSQQQRGEIDEPPAYTAVTGEDP